MGHVNKKNPFLDIMSHSRIDPINDFRIHIRESDTEEHYLEDFRDNEQRVDNYDTDAIDGGGLGRDYSYINNKTDKVGDDRYFHFYEGER